MNRSYVAGRELGRGCWKVCYALKNHPGRVALVVYACDHRLTKLEAELATLEKLREMGFPVLQTWGIDLVWIYGRLVHAIIAKKMAAHSKDGGYKYNEHLNRRSLRIINKIDRTMKKLNLYIDDLQFMVDKKGGIVIADPLGYDYGYDSYQIHHHRNRTQSSISLKEAA